MSTDKKLTWEEQVGAFAKAVGKNIDDINKALETLTGEPGDEALAVLSDPSALSDEDIKAVLVGTGPSIPLGVFKKHISVLRGPSNTPVVAESSTGTPADFLLPNVPDDESFILALKVGGVLKTSPTAVLSAVKAAIAQKVHLFDVPDILKDKMERFADEQEESVGDDYFKLLELVTTRNYADVLSAMGVKGAFMSESKKKQFFAKVDEHLWSSIRSFDSMLHQWYESWTATAANPAFLMSALVMGKSGQNVLPPNMLQAPETAVLHDEAEKVVNTINKVFSGVGIQVAAALAYDATRIKGVLENPAIPAATGFTSKEQMLKGLKISVSSDYPRLERNLARYILGVMEFPKVTTPSEEISYLGALLQLGGTIQWDKLGLPSSNGVMSRSHL